MTHTLPRTAKDAAQAYLAAWNAHDGAAVAATLAPHGTYIDPTLPAPIGGEALIGYVAALTGAFPDLRFEVEQVSADNDRVIVAWRMRGTNTGLLPAMPEPTGSACDLPGIDVITVDDAGIVSVVGYFDQKTFVEQLGLQALVVPANEPPLLYGISARTDLDNTAVPGALSFTWIDVSSEQEQLEVQRRTSEVLQGLAAEPGFIGWMGTSAGLRGHTVTLWRSTQAAEAAIGRSRAHRDGVDRVRSRGLGTRVFSSIWIPHRLNNQLARCPDCSATVDIPGGATARCACGREATISSYI
jgi:steroid delta-isomerase-like uncharacterized protein